MGSGERAASISIDGGSRGNPGDAAAGVIIKDAGDGVVLFSGGFFLGMATNNVAEYHALLEALSAARRLHLDAVDVSSDSQLLVRQMNGRYRVKNAGIKPLFERACRLREQFSRFSISHVRREDNKAADKLVNQALNRRQNVEDAAGES